MHARSSGGLHHGLEESRLAGIFQVLFCEYLFDNGLSESVGVSPRFGLALPKESTPCFKVCSDLYWVYPSALSLVPD